jgi:glycosyltransferase involved in cell wall biosynthesis
VSEAVLDVGAAPRASATTVADHAATMPARPPATDAANDVDVSIILPAYDEELALGDDLDAVHQALTRSGRRFEIIVVDDGSRDATPAIAASREWVRLLSHRYNRGNGAARTTGVRAARGSVVVFTDADRTYPNDRIPELLDRIDAGADMVIGARRVEAGTLRWLRRPAKELLRRLAEFMTGSQIPDLNSGLRAQRRDVTLRFLPLLPTSHSWVSTITIAFLAEGYVVEWLPIDYYPRVGRSTFHPVRDTYNYLSLIVRTVMYFNPLKVFLPVSMALLAAGIAKYVGLDIVARYGFPPAAVPQMSGTSLALLITGMQVAAIGLLADLVVRRTRL